MTLDDFVRESNAIEGIRRDPTYSEVQTLRDFVAKDEIRVYDICYFVSVYQPDAQLRDHSRVPGVRVGNHIAPASGPEIVGELQRILSMGVRCEPFAQHMAYETLHPFTDGNGRSGRALWLWAMGGHTSLPFLHRWYYQSLDNTRRTE